MANVLQGENEASDAVTPAARTVNSANGNNSIVAAEG